MKTTVDQLGRTVTYNFPPKRIISFAPAITDTLYHLGLDEEMIGRTRFCIHPKGRVERAVNVGGTKDMKLDRVMDLQPDLIIAEKEENTKEMVEQLAEHFPVYVCEVQTVSDALQLILDLGTTTNKIDHAQLLHSEITKAFTRIPAHFKGKKVAYVIWKDPYMVVGKNTYIKSLLEKLGFINPFTSFEGRYPCITETDFHDANLDYILLATEPYPFKEEHKAAFTELSPNAETIIVDGEMFWYGVKMLEAVTYFNEEFLK